MREKKTLKKSTPFITYTMITKFWSGSSKWNTLLSSSMNLNRYFYSDLFFYTYQKSFKLMFKAGF